MEHENLIKARKEKGLTQKEMANMLAMEQTTYSKKEKGISRIREEEWSRFAKILGKDIEAIKNKKPQHNEICNHEMYLEIIAVILKYNQKLQEENFLLKELLEENSKI